ncbi:MAG: AsmA family protein [Nitrospinae bacterium]|nr:AsmA family protein [Nitrospinota bacterium]
MAVSKKKIALYSLASLAGILIIFVAIVGTLYVKFSDLERFKEMAVERLEGLTGKKVSIGSAEMDFIKGLSVKLKEVTIGGAYEGKPKFYAKSLWMVIKLLPLLNQRIEIKKIQVEGVYLQLIRDRKGRWNFGRLPQLISQPEEDDFIEVLKGSLINKLEIKGGEIRFIDFKTFPQKTPPPLQLNNVHVLIQKKFLKIPYEFLFRGEILNPDRPTKIEISGTLDNPTMTWDLAGFFIDGKVKIQDLPMARFRPYFKKINPALFGEGRMSLESNFSGRLSGIMESSGKLKFTSQKEVSGPVLRDPSVPHRGTLDYEIILNKDTLRVKEIKMVSDAFGFTAKGTLGKYFSKDPLISFDVKTGAFQVNKSESYLPLEIIPKEYHQLVQKQFRNGTFEIESLKFKGTLSQLKNLTVDENIKLLTGKVRMKHMDWQDPLPRLKHVTGSFSLESGNGVLKIEKARFLGHPIANVQGTINNVVDRPIIDVSLDNKIELGQFHPTLMKALEGHSFRDFISIYSEMSGPGSVRIHLEGPLLEPDKLALTGNIFMRDVSLYQEGIGPRIEHLQGKIDFNLIPPGSGPDKKSSIPIIVFDNFSGNFGKSAFSKVFGKVVMENDVPLKEMVGTYNLDVDELPAIISDLDLEYPFDILHQGTRYTRGRVQVNFKSLGNPMVPETVKDWGEIELQDLSLQYEDKYWPMSNLSGVIEFGEGLLRMVEVKGWYGDSPFQLDGYLTPYAQNGPEFELVVKSPNFHSSGLKNIPFLKNLKYTGTIKTELKIKGSIHDLEFDHKLDLSQASYQYKDLFIKPRNAFNNVELKGRFDSKEGIVVRNIVYNLEENRIVGKANIKNLDNPEFFVQIISKNFKTELLAKFLKPFRINRKGSADFKIQGRGNFNHLENSRFKGMINLKNLEFLPEDYDQVLTLNAGIKFAGNTFQISGGRLASDLSTVLFEGIYQRGPKPNVNIRVSGKRLVLEEFLPSKNEGEANLVSFLNESELFSKGTTNISFDLDKLDYKRLTLNMVSGNISIEKKKIKINKLDLGKEGKIRGRGMLEMGDSDGLRFKGLIQAEKIPAQEFFSLFGNTFQNGLTGQLKTLDIRVKGQGKGLKEIWKSLIVESSFDFGSGQIDHGRLKTGALRLFGFQEEADESAGKTLEESFAPYEQIAGKFSLVKGIASTENFIYEDKKRRSSLVGTFDLNKYEMDTILGVAPLAALDKFLTKIPVFGKILTSGDEESLVKTYFTVKGKFDKPEIKAIPFTSLTKKVVGIFQGFWQTPKYILNPQREETN